MLPLIISLFSGCLYWGLEEKITTHRFGKHHLKILALLKWIAVVGLIIEHLSIHYHIFFERLIYIFHKCMIFTMYAVGDIIIIFNQHYSITFFMCGHILLLIECTLKIIVLTTKYLVGIIAFAVITTACFGYIYKKYNNNIDNCVYGLYITYIFILSLVLVIPVISSGYFGGYFFVISDLLIGFKIKQLSKFTFPLYYTSLLCLLYLYTTHE